MTEKVDYLRNGRTELTLNMNMVWIAKLYYSKLGTTEPKLGYWPDIQRVFGAFKYNTAYIPMVEWTYYITTWMYFPDGKRLTGSRNNVVTGLFGVLASH